MEEKQEDPSSMGNIRINLDLNSMNFSKQPDDALTSNGGLESERTK